MPSSNSSSKGKLGIPGFVILTLLIAYSVFIFFNSFNAPYWVAQREYKQHPVESVNTLVNLARKDKKESVRSLQALCNLDGVPVIAGLIDLMDLQDGEWTSAGNRQLLWSALLQKVKGFKGIPTYSPSASRQDRDKQKLEWQNWLVRNRSSM